MDETRMTKTGNAIGTFHYIAPERLDNRPTRTPAPTSTRWHACCMNP